MDPRASSQNKEHPACPSVGGPQWPWLPSPGGGGQERSPAPGGTPSPTRGGLHTHGQELQAAHASCRPPRRAPGLPCRRRHRHLAEGPAPVTLLSVLQAPGRLTTTSSAVGTHSARGARRPAAWRTPSTGPACGVLWPSEGPGPTPGLPSGPTPTSRDRWPPRTCSARPRETLTPVRKPDFEVSLLLLPASSPSVTTMSSLSQGTGSLLSPHGLQPLHELRLARPFAETLWNVPATSRHSVRWSQGLQADGASFLCLGVRPRRPRVLAASSQTPTWHFLVSGTL